MIKENEVEAYKQILAAEEARYMEVIAKCERKLSILRTRMKFPKDWLKKEIKEGSLRAASALGQVVPSRKSNLPKKNSEQSTKVFSEETADLPLKEEVEEKASFGFFK